MKKKWLAVFICIQIVFLIGLNLIIYFFQLEDNILYNLNFKIAHQEKRKEIRGKKAELSKVSLIAVGDIMLSRDVDSTIKRRGSYYYPFEKVKNYLNTGDIVFGNLEVPITPGRQIVTEEMVFRADPEVAPVLADTGFNVFSIANNHIMNFGMKGLEDTKKYLEEQNIAYAQDKEVARIKKNGIKFSFLAYSYNFGLNAEKMTWQTEAEKEVSDIIIVSVHFGNEYTAKPSIQQIDFAHTAIDAGADLVLGHHPHVTQSLEKYKDKYIFYSLGNFVFDQMWSEETKKGLITKLIFTRDGVESMELEDIYIVDFAQPIFSEKSDSIYERLQIDFEENNLKTNQQENSS